MRSHHRTFTAVSTAASWTNSNWSSNVLLESRCSAACKPWLQFSSFARRYSTTLEDNVSPTSDLLRYEDDYDPEAELLLRGQGPIRSDLATNHSTRTTPVFTSGALDVLGPNVIPQRAVYGSVLSTHHQTRAVADSDKSARPTKLYVNTNAPFSAVVCGLQVWTPIDIFKCGDSVFVCLWNLCRGRGKATRRPFFSRDV